MSYNSNVPQAASKRSISQKQIRSNYQAIYAAFARNHAVLGGENQGQHNVLTLRDQAMVDPVTSATETAIYNKLVAGVPNLFFRPSNSQTPIQMTYPSISVSQVAPYASQQYTFVAGPFIFYSGLLTGVVQNQLVTLSPGTTLLYVGLTALGVSNSLISNTIIPTNIAGTSFNIRYETGVILQPASVYYLAIGQ